MRLAEADLLRSDGDAVVAALVEERPVVGAVRQILGEPAALAARALDAAGTDTTVHEAEPAGGSRGRHLHGRVRVSRLQHDEELRTRVGDHGARGRADRRAGKRRRRERQRCESSNHRASTPPHHRVPSRRGRAAQLSTPTRVASGIAPAGPSLDRGNERGPGCRPSRSLMQR